VVTSGNYSDDHHYWIKLTQEFSNEEEGGKRCAKCIKYRLMQTAFYAKSHQFDCFATTLSVSPHKNIVAINSAGEEISTQLQIDFLDSDFKKNDGYKKSIELSKKYAIYRQNYCGCEYSMKLKAKS
jgi:predicted adenine nucleotide alpha hydrolase (AANH) superfamily ATPase